MFIFILIIFVIILILVLLGVIQERSRPLSTDVVHITLSPYKVYPTIYFSNSTSSEHFMSIKDSVVKAIAFPGGGIRGAIQSAILWELQEGLNRDSDTEIPDFKDHNKELYKLIPKVDEPYKSIIKRHFVSSDSKNNSKVKLIGYNDNSTDLSYARDITIYGSYKSTNQIQDKFDLFAGTSTGAIIATFLSTDLSNAWNSLVNEINAENMLPNTPPHVIKNTLKAQKILKTVNKIADDLRKDMDSSTPVHVLMTLYQLLGEYIFTRGLTTLHTDIPLDYLLHVVCKKRKLNSAKKNLLITSTSLSMEEGIAFRSYDTKIPYDNLSFRAMSDQLNMAEVVRASTAAPIYFPPQKMLVENDKHEIMTYQFVDGGMYSNDPTDIAFHDLIELYPSAKGYLIVTVGNGLYTKKDMSIKGNLLFIQDIPEIIFATMHSNQAKTQDIMETIVKSAKVPVCWINLAFNIPEELSQMNKADYKHVLTLHDFGRCVYRAAPDIMAYLQNLLR